MKAVLMALVGLVATSAMAADICKPGDYKDCSVKLKSLNQKEKGPEFQKHFDDVCMASKKFKCVKKIVRGEISDEMKYTKEENPKASLFSAVIDGENYIYIFSQK